MVSSSVLSEEMLRFFTVIARVFVSAKNVSPFDAHFGKGVAAVKFVDGFLIEFALSSLRKTISSCGLEFLRQLVGGANTGPLVARSAKWNAIVALMFVYAENPKTRKRDLRSLIDIVLRSVKYLKSDAERIRFFGMFWVKQERKKKNENFKILFFFSEQNNCQHSFSRSDCQANCAVCSSFCCICVCSRVFAGLLRLCQILRVLSFFQCFENGFFGTSVDVKCKLLSAFLRSDFAEFDAARTFGLANHVLDLALNVANVNGAKILVCISRLCRMSTGLSVAQLQQCFLVVLRAAPPLFCSENDFEIAFEALLACLTNARVLASHPQFFAFLDSVSQNLKSDSASLQMIDVLRSIASLDPDFKACFAVLVRSLNMVLKTESCSGQVVEKIADLISKMSKGAVESLVSNSLLKDVITVVRGAKSPLQMLHSGRLHLVKK
jgi:hypothetical protein